jgi:hypothetical protein
MGMYLVPVNSLKDGGGEKKTKIMWQRNERVHMWQGKRSRSQIEKNVVDGKVKDKPTLNTEGEINLETSHKHQNKVQFYHHTCKQGQHTKSRKTFWWIYYYWMGKNFQSRKAMEEIAKGK